MVYLHVGVEEGDGGTVKEDCEEEDERDAVVEVGDGEGSVIVGEESNGRQGPVGGPPMNLTSPM